MLRVARPQQNGCVYSLSRAPEGALCSRGKNSAGVHFLSRTGGRTELSPSARKYSVVYGHAKLPLDTFLDLVKTATPSYAGLKSIASDSRYQREYLLLCWLYLSPTPPSVYTKWPQLGVIITRALCEETNSIVLDSVKPPSGVCGYGGPNGPIVKGRIKPRVLRPNAYAAVLALDWADDSCRYVTMPCGCAILHEWESTNAAPVSCLYLAGDKPCTEETHRAAKAKRLNNADDLVTLGAKWLVGVDYTWPPECSQADAKQLLSAGQVWAGLEDTTKAKWRRVFTVYGHAPFTNVAMANLFLVSEHDWTVIEAVTRYTQWNVNFLDYVKIMKLLHTHVRVCGLTLHSGAVCSLTYRRNMYGLDYLAGRSDHYKLDFVDEMSARCVPSTIRGVPSYASGRFTFDRDLYDKLFKEEVDRALDDILSAEVHLLSYDQLMDRRMNWVSSGSAPGIKLRVSSEVAQLGPRTGTSDETKTEVVSVNKRLAFLHLDRAAVRNELGNLAEAVLHSRHATKYEPGKKRALWNTGLMHYSASSILLEQFGKNERKNVDWYMPSHTAGYSLHEDLARCEALGERVGLMWDFSDFNINHLLPHMAYLYIAAAKKLVERNVSGQGMEETLAAAQWISAATLETILEDVTSGLVVKVSRSLMTGVRGTSFVNTILNRVYTRVALRTIAMLGGGESIRDPIYAFGDDVFATADTHCDAVLFCQVMNVLGTAGTKYKINLELGELLRVSYDRSSFTGYPLRAIVGLVSGEYFEGHAINDIHQRAAAFHDQLAKCVNRGACIDVRKWSRMLTRLHCSVVYTRGAKRKTRRPIMELLYVPKSFGGLGLITKDMPRGLKLHEWTSGSNYPTFSFRADFARAIGQGDVHDMALLASLPHLDDRSRLMVLAQREIGESAVSGKAPPSEVKAGYDRYIEGLESWYNSLERGREIVPLSTHLRWDYEHVQSLWLGLKYGEMAPYAYGTSAFMASAAGMSSNSAFLQVLKQFQRACGGQLAMAIIDFSRRTMPPHLSLRCMRIAALLAKLPQRDQAAWFNGEYGLLPVPDSGSSKVNSVIRWITLKMVESDLEGFFGPTDRREVVFRIAAAERKVAEFVRGEINKVVDFFGD